MNNVMFEILRTVKNQEEVSDKPELKVLMEEGYLDENQQLTMKGQVYLDSHKVDNAIILAAGMGTRFVPHTLQTPKGLIEVHGEVMVERQVKQLIEAGIRDIIIIVGYKGEQFEYLVDKYGVTIVKNPDYKGMNNISSLFHAKEYLKNSYILMSDIYMEENVYHQYENKAWYASVFFEEETSEWTLSFNVDDRITDVKIGGKNKWAMYGPVFFDETFSNKIKKYIVEDYHNPSKSNYFWENVYMDRIDEFDLYVNRFPQGIIHEFESFEELRNYDVSYIEDSRNKVIKKIAQVMEVKEGAISNIELLEKGMTNKSFIFEVEGKKYVYRHPGHGSDRLINRQQEFQVYQAIEPLDIADEIVYMNPESGIKITRYYDNSTQADPQNQEDVKAQLDLIKTLHSSKITVDHRFDIRERLSYYESLVEEVRAKYPSDFEVVKAQNLKVLDYIDGLNREHILCHVDSVFNNLIKLKDESYRLIDWEYAGMSEPLVDIAAYVVYAGFEEDELDMMLEYYYERQPTFEEKNVCYGYVALLGLLWSLWTWFKEAEGDDFGEYGAMQYHYAKKYSNIVLESLEHE